MKLFFKYLIFLGGLGLIVFGTLCLPIHASEKAHKTHLHDHDDEGHEGHGHEEKSDHDITRIMVMRKNHTNLMTVMKDMMTTLIMMSMEGKLLSWIKSPGQ